MTFKNMKCCVRHPAAPIAIEDCLFVERPLSGEPPTDHTLTAFALYSLKASGNGLLLHWTRLR